MVVEVVSRKSTFQRGIKNMPEKIMLPEDLDDKVARFPEYSFGAHLVCVILKDGRSYENVIVGGGQVVKVDGKNFIPFKSDDIADVVNRA